MRLLDAIMNQPQRGARARMANFPLHDGLAPGVSDAMSRIEKADDAFQRALGPKVNVNRTTHVQIHARRKFHPLGNFSWPSQSFPNARRRNVQSPHQFDADHILQAFQFASLATAPEGPAGAPASREFRNCVPGCAHAPANPRSRPGPKTEVSCMTATSRE